MVSSARLRLLSQLPRLVRRASGEGDRLPAADLAFHRLYRTAYGFVRQRARSLLRSEDEALDAAQEAFTRGWENWRTLSAARSQVGWLIVIVTRICIDRRRRLRPEDGARSQVPLRSPESVHLARLLWLRLDDEAPLRQQVVIHSWVDGMTQDETAAVLGISRKTVQRQLEAFRAKHAPELASLSEVPGGL